MLSVVCKTRRSMSIQAANILQRYPVVFSKLTMKEKELEAMYEQFLYEESKLSFTEYAEYEEYVSKDTNAGRKQDLLDRLVYNPIELMAKQPPANSASVLAQAEINFKSPRRKLDQMLYLIVKDKDNNNTWGFPCAEIIAGETLRSAAERALMTATLSNQKQQSDAIVTYTVSNAPSGCLEKESTSVKLFYYLTQYIEGDVVLNNDKYTDYAWVAKQELHTFLDKPQLEVMEDILV